MPTCCAGCASGNLIWDVAYADNTQSYGATSAPLIVKDKVLVGTSGGDDGVRGFVAAFDVQTGKEVWRFWTIPARVRKDRKPGRSAKIICVAAAPRGCQEPTILN